MIVNMNKNPATHDWPMAILSHLCTTHGQDAAANIRIPIIECLHLVSLTMKYLLIETLPMPTIRTSWSQTIPFTPEEVHDCCC